MRLVTAGMNVQSRLQLKGEMFTPAEQADPQKYGEAGGFIFPEKNVRL